MFTQGVLFSFIVSILLICPIVADIDSTVDFGHNIQDSADDEFNSAELSVNADFSSVSTLNLTADSRAFFDQVKCLFATENMTDDERFNEFKILLAKSTAILFDKLEIDPLTTATATKDGKSRQKRAPKKSKRKRKFWFKIFVEGGW